MIHPNQIDVVNSAFMPSEQKQEWAQELIKSFYHHQESGKVRITAAMILFLTMTFDLGITNKKLIAVVTKLTARKMETKLIRYLVIFQSLKLCVFHQEIKAVSHKLKNKES